MNSYYEEMKVARKSEHPETQITVYDVPCGYGKSTSVMNYINKSSPYRRFLVLVEYEREMNRYEGTCSKLVQPQDKHPNGGKLESFRELLDEGKNIVTSHVIADRLTDDDWQKLRAKEYSLFIDEELSCIAAYSPDKDEDLFNRIKKDFPTLTEKEQKKILTMMNRMSQDDIELFVQSYCVEDPKTKLLSLKAIDEDGEEREPVSTIYSHLIDLVKAHKLVHGGKGKLLRIFPPTFLKAISDIRILTYGFENSIFDCYLQVFGYGYYYGYISNGQKTDENGFKFESKDPLDRELTYDKEKAIYIPTDYKHLIRIWDDKHIDEYLPEEIQEKMKKMGKLNAPGHGDCALSYTAYKTKMTKDEVKKMLKNTHNWCRNYAHLNPSQMFFVAYNCTVDDDSDRNFWTTDSLKAKYKNRHVPCNIRATNDYANCSGVAYLINRFMHGSVYNYFDSIGCTPDKDKFSTNELVQTIFRSGIRNGQRIDVYIPSSRMRGLLRNWISEQEALNESFYKSQIEDENVPFS